MPAFRCLAGIIEPSRSNSPGWGFIEQVEDLLFGGTRARDIKDAVIGQLYHLSDTLPGLCRRFRLPLAQSSIQLLRQGVHDGFPSSFLV